ncbi:rRNA maturation RNase YbeY [Microgenomates group bacterium]|nr:rRNA maturation RNase YbeY [Microgenomates group bacterium]
MLEINFNVGSHYLVDRKLLRGAAEKMLLAKGIDHAHLEVSVVGRRRMKYLNEKIVKHEGITDVLSFPHSEKGEVNDFPMPEGIPPTLGEVVICFPVAVKEARDRGKMVDKQLQFYLEHGIMHLLGYHHDDGMK